MYKRLTLLSMILFLSLSSIAATFSVLPLAGHPLPTLVNANETTPAFYTITNNTGKTLDGIYLAYLPDNVVQVTTGTVPHLCGRTFSLVAGGSCTLQLSISGTVTSSSTDPHQHLYLCLPGATTCSGTPLPLNVSLSGWRDLGLPAQKDTSLDALVTAGTTVYAAGRGHTGYPQYWKYSGNQWTSVEPIPHGDTGKNAVITTLTPHLDFLYLGVTGASKAWVYKYLSNETSENTALPTLQEPGPLSSVQVSVMDPLANRLYVAGLGLPSSQLPNPPGDFSLFGGRLYYYNGTGWIETSPSISASTSFSSYSSMALDQISGILYVAGYGLSSLTGPIIGTYNTNTNEWGVTYVIITADNSIASSINSITLDSNGTLFAGGIDRNNLGVVWKYVDSGWQRLPTIPAALSVQDITFDNNNHLVATGDGTDSYGRVWSYNSQTNDWTTLSISNSNGINAIAFDTNNILYALGFDLQYAPKVWAYP